MDITTSETPENGLSEKMLHSKLAISLRNNGTLDSLKSQLRAKVLSDLRAGGIVPIKRTRTLFEEAALHIVMDHLRTGGFKCSLSVFIPESGLPLSSMHECGDETRFSVPLDMLGIRQNSRLDRHIQSVASKSGSLLRLIVEYLSLENSDRVGFAEASSQTAVEESIDQKLKRIDEKFQGLLAAEQSYPIKSFEERRVQWQREADERLRTEVEEAVGRVRRVEISKVRLEEQSRYQSMLAEVKSDWEKAYQKRLEDLQKRESDASDRLERKRQEFEENSYQHRQRMLAEMNLLRQRDVENKRQTELAQSTLHKQEICQQEARLKDLEHALELKLIEAERSAQQQAKDSGSTLSRLKADLFREHEESQRAVATAQRELETQTQQLQIAREAFNDALAESRLAREENAVLRGDLERMRRQYEGSRQDLSAERDQLQRRHDECENLNTQIDALKKQNLELENLVSSLKASTPISRPIEPLLTQLEEMRSSHSAERQLREKEIRKLNAELKAAKRYADQLQQQLADLEAEHSRCLARIREQADELNSAQKEAAERALELKMARHEVTDVRRLLEHSQALLSKESSQAESHGFPARSLRATRDRSIEVSQTGFDTRAGPSHGVQRLLNQARSDAAEYAAATRPRQNSCETPADAWDVEFQRALQTIKQLEKEDLALKLSRDALMNSSDRIKIVRVQPDGQGRTARQEHAIGSGFRPDILRPPVIDERGEDERQPVASGDNGLLDEDKVKRLAKNGALPSHPSEHRNMRSGPIPAAPLAIVVDKRKEQDLVNLDEEAARFLFDRSEKCAPDDIAGLQHTSRRPAELPDNFPVRQHKEHESHEEDANRVRKELGTDEPEKLQTKEDEEQRLEADSEQLRAEETRKQQEEEKVRIEAERAQMAEEEKRLKEEAKLESRRQLDEERLHAEETKRKADEEHQRCKADEERLQREKARKQQELEEQEKAEQIRNEADLAFRLQQEEEERHRAEEAEILRRKSDQEERLKEDAERLQREEARKQQELEEHEKAEQTRNDAEQRQREEADLALRLQQEEERHRAEEAEILRRKSDQEQRLKEDAELLQREEARKQQEIEHQELQEAQRQQQKAEQAQREAVQEQLRREVADLALREEEEQQQRAEEESRKRQELEVKQQEEIRKAAEEQRQREELALRRQRDEEMQNQKLVLERAQRAAEEQEQREAAELALKRQEEEQQRAEEFRLQQEKEENDRRQNEERMRAQEIASKTAEGENLISEFAKAIQDEDVAQAQDYLRQARKTFQECGVSDHDSTLASCEEKLQLLRVQMLMVDAEQHLNSARHEMSSGACTPAVIVRARDSVQEAKKLLSQIPSNTKEARDTLSHSISVISSEIDAAESSLGAVEDEGTDHLYMQCFQQEEGNGIASDSPQHDIDTDIHQGSDGLEVQSFHYSSGGEVDDFAAHSNGNDEDDYF